MLIETQHRLCTISIVPGKALGSYPSDVTMSYCPVTVALRQHDMITSWV
jgi:hypothetical protein